MSVPKRKYEPTLEYCFENAATDEYHWESQDDFPATFLWGQVESLHEKVFFIDEADATEETAFQPQSREVLSAIDTEELYEFPSQTDLEQIFEPMTSTPSSGDPLNQVGSFPFLYETQEYERFELPAEEKIHQDEKKLVRCEANDSLERLTQALSEWKAGDIIVDPDLFKS